MAGIVGLGAAAEIARAEMADDAARLVRIRDYIIDTIAATIRNAYLIGDRYRRLPGHICLGFDGQEGEAIKLLMELDEAGIAVSSGSACSSSHAGQPSHVLEAMGFDALQGAGIAADHAGAVQYARGGRQAPGSASPRGRSADRSAACCGSNCVQPSAGDDNCCMATTLQKGSDCGRYLT